jgi:LuxR family maltose regulon positive regulatory protein
MLIFRKVRLSMPKYAHYQLKWSEQAQSYVLSIGDQASEQALTSDWLEQIASFSFHSRSGMHYTVRKQRVQRGSSYWYGYRRLHGDIVKRYLGRTADLTLARLEEIARLLEGRSGSRQRSFQSQRGTALSQPVLHVSPSSDAVRPSPIAALPLLLSKLSPPRLHADLLDRSRLFALLDAGRECHLTLLSAPAGSGKTTLVCQWIAARQASLDFPPVAWVSLEASDNDPLRFWRYLITACQEFQVDLQEVHDALQNTIPQPPFVPASLEVVLTGLLNALARCPSGGTLVLEDYHVITSQEIHKTLSFFLDHLPPTMHLIMITRSDPPFSLARLRAHNDLYEVRTADLRFSQEEMTALLQQSLSFQLTAESIQRLHTQLEGWGVGLHLVKLALQRTTTTAQGEQTLALFTTSSASLQEYFVTEVLELQPESVQHFLLQTSILTRLTGSLCDAVVEQQNSQDMLAMLERANLFLEPLDNAGQWYRYHALFAEAMRNEARRSLGEQQLHGLSAHASRWYEEHGFLSEAIDAALYAQDYERAASLIERSIDLQISPGEMHESHTLHRWLEQLPETILKQHPMLCLSYATTLLFLSTSWRPDGVTLRLLEKLLDMAEQLFLEENNLPKLLQYPQTDRHNEALQPFSLPAAQQRQVYQEHPKRSSDFALGELFAFRSLLAWRLDDTPAAARYAQQALDWLPKTQPTWRVLSLCMVGRECLDTGQFPQARAALLEAHTLCETIENHYFKLVSTILLAQVLFEQGELQQASTFYRQALASGKEDEQAGALCVALIGLAALSYEWNELESAYQYAQKAIELSQSRNLQFHELRAMLLQVRVQQTQGQITEAQQRLAALLDKMPAHLTQEIQTAQARLALVAEDHMTMQRWATGRKPHPDYSQRLEEELLLTRWLRVQDKQEEALRQLERLLAAAREVEHTRRILEIQVEIVLVAAARKRMAEAQQLLREVLTLAFDGNSMRLFIDAGEQMAVLLRTLLPQLHEQPLLAYIRTLLNAFPVHQQKEIQAPAASLLEPLSPQEMRVLRLLVQHRSNAEIARELVVSINTVRTQVQSIYHKLGVHKRSAAAEVARDLHLL